MSLKDFMVVVWVLIFGAALTACTPGPVGNQGSVGATGLTGAAGPAGADGNTITIVQFCPGITPSYPSTFPEIGECINGNLYAVYSINGGFLSLITPGVYSSDGVNASCTFTVLSNCVIQN